jgi:Txe/YoeB family toxin of Txe-Axe toxin-antitoxin module
MERHILSQHGLSGEPIDSATGLTRVQSRARGSYGNRYFNGARSQLQQGPWPSYYPYRSDTQNESDKRFWELADRVKDLKVLEMLREMQRDIVTIMQQNNQIIALLVGFFNARPG